MKIKLKHLLPPASEGWGKVMFWHVYVCLFTWGVPILPNRGYPILPDRGVCTPILPHILHNRGYLHLRMGVVPLSDIRLDGVPPPQQAGWMVNPPSDWMGVPPWDTEQHSEYFLRWAVCLLRSRRTFLFHTELRPKFKYYNLLLQGRVTWSWNGSDDVDSEVWTKQTKYCFINSQWQSKPGRQSQCFRKKEKIRSMDVSSFDLKFWNSSILMGLHFEISKNSPFES